MKVEKKFYICHSSTGDYYVPERRPKKITNQTHFATGTLVGFLHKNSHHQAKEITVTVES